VHHPHAGIAHGKYLHMRPRARFVLGSDWQFQQIFLWQRLLIAGCHHLVLSIQQIQAAQRASTLPSRRLSMEILTSMHKAPRNCCPTQMGWLMVSICPLPAWSIYTGVITRRPCGLTVGWPCAKTGQQAVAGL
jgi:hypothetical protein